MRALGWVAALALATLLIGCTRSTQLQPEGDKLVRLAADAPDAREGVARKAGWHNVVFRIHGDRTLHPIPAGWIWLEEGDGVRLRRVGDHVLAIADRAAGRVDMGARRLPEDTKYIAWIRGEQKTFVTMGDVDIGVNGSDMVSAVVEGIAKLPFVAIGKLVEDALGLDDVKDVEIDDHHWRRTGPRIRDRDRRDDD